MLCNSKNYTTYHMKNNYMTLKNPTMRHYYSARFARTGPDCTNTKDTNTKRTTLGGVIGEPRFP